MTPSPYACDAAGRRSFIVNGMTLRALEWGQPGRPALCFLHGGSAHAHWFDAVVPAFVDSFHIISLDQRGHGESDWAPDARYGTEQFASDLVGVMDHLGWAQMVVVGHSMGGHNAMGFSAWHADRVRGLCVVDSRPSLPAERLQAMHRRGHRGPRRHETLDSALRSFRLLPAETLAAPDLLEHLGRQGITQREGRFLYRFDPQCNGARNPADGWSLLPQIKAPALLVRGELSPIMPEEMAERMKAAIPNARLVTMLGVYHHLVLDAPEAFSRILDDFLRDLPAGEAR
ncbi:MAG TPA: alpha/beta hydrolase [Methylomirabilota bacterium]